VSAKSVSSTSLFFIPSNLTNQPITSTEEAWQVLHAYVHRWQVEMAFRFFKAKLALESLRL
jgi:hypothetical protein